MTASDWPAGAEASDLGRFEPSAYDLGITDDPEPVPYSLTAEGEAALAAVPDWPWPGSDDPERLAQWCGFPSAAAHEAAREARGREMAAESAAEMEWEAECERLAAEAEDPEAEP